MRYVWIVEMWYSNKWHPTIGCRLTKNEGLSELREWKKKNPYDSFQLVKYVRE